MARFLFYLPRYHTNLIPWVRILQHGGHEVAVRVQRVGPTEDHRLVEPVLLPPARMSSILKRILPRKPDEDYYSYPAMAGCWRDMREIDPDVVIVRGVSRWMCRLAAVIAVLQGRRLAIYDQDPANPRRWSGTWIRRAALALCGIPHFTVRRPRESEPRDRGSARTIPFGAREPSAPMAEAARVRHQLEPAVPRILMVGKYRTRKGHSILLEALARLAPRYIFEVTFCGEEEGEADLQFRRALEERARELGLADRTRFKANLDSAAMMAEYAGNEIFVLPSLNEPAAVSPVEAVWNGCAALVDNHSGTRGYFPPDNAVDASVPKQLAQRLEIWLSDPVALRTARRECLEFLTSFSSDEMIFNRFTQLAASRFQRLRSE